MLELILPPILAAVFLACISGPLGCFVVWKKMAYFGDTVAHAALLGVGLGVILSIATQISVIILCLLVAILVAYFNSKKYLSTDTTLGILAHGSLALGMLTVTVVSPTRINLQGILMGDLLTVGYSEALHVGILSIVIIALIVKLWRHFLMSAIDEDLATVEGYSPNKNQFLLTLTIALTIAFGIKLVGALLISGLLIIPAAGARKLSSSPEAMAITAGLIGLVSSVLGLISSAYWDLPAGPAIVCCALLIFIAALFYPRKMT